MEKAFTLDIDGRTVPVRLEAVDSETVAVPVRDLKAALEALTGVVWTFDVHLAETEPGRPAPRIGFGSPQRSRRSAP